MGDMSVSGFSNRIESHRKNNRKIILYPYDNVEENSQQKIWDFISEKREAKT